MRPLGQFLYYKTEREKGSKGRRKGKRKGRWHKLISKHVRLRQTGGPSQGQGKVSLGYPVYYPIKAIA